MVDLEEYLALRSRPPGPPAMFQRWRDLAFLHFSAEPAAIQPLLPEGLSVDTYADRDGRERAWIGLVPFRMEGVRHRGTPPVHGCHAFPETNVRTYVHREGKRPGVWFFSLDAANPVACAVARATFNLPYFPARMTVSRGEDSAEYRSSRWRSRREGPAETPSLQASIGLGSAVEPPAPGSLEFFLVERYLLYAYRRGQLYTGQVSHAPYPIREARIQTIDETLVEAARIETRPWEHTMFSDGVDVEVFSIRPVG